MKYRLERHGNPEYGTIHITKKIRNDSNHERFDIESEQNPAFVNHLLRIPGIIIVGIWGPYQISLQRGMAFEWDELFPAALLALKDYLLDPGEELVEAGSAIRNDLAVERELQYGDPTQDY